MSYATYSYIFDILKAAGVHGFLKLLPGEAIRQRSLQLQDMLKTYEGATQ